MVVESRLELDCLLGSQFVLKVNSCWPLSADLASFSWPLSAGLASFCCPQCLLSLVSAFLCLSWLLRQLGFSSVLNRTQYNAIILISFYMTCPHFTQRITKIKEGYVNFFNVFPVHLGPVGRHGRMYLYSS